MPMATLHISPKTRNYHSLCFQASPQHQPLFSLLWLSLYESNGHSLILMSLIISPLVKGTMWAQLPSLPATTLTKTKWLKEEGRTLASGSTYLTLRQNHYVMLQYYSHASFTRLLQEVEQRWVHEALLSSRCPWVNLNSTTDAVQQLTGQTCVCAEHSVSMYWEFRDGPDLI